MLGRLRPDLIMFLLHGQPGCRGGAYKQTSQLNPQGRVVGQGGSVSEGHTDEISVSPDQTACSSGAKIVERQFESHRHNVDSIHADPGAGICKVAKAAVDGPTLGIEPQSCVP
jgi:hypothetical protein